MNCKQGAVGRLRWKKELHETGLRAVGAGPRSSWLHDGVKRYACVSAVGGDWRARLTGWYFVAGWEGNVPHINTHDKPCATEDEAKAAAMKYVRDALREGSLPDRANPARDESPKAIEQEKP